MRVSEMGIMTALVLCCRHTVDLHTNGFAAGTIPAWLCTARKFRYAALHDSHDRLMISFPNLLVLLSTPCAYRYMSLVETNLVGTLPNCTIAT